MRNVAARLAAASRALVVAGGGIAAVSGAGAASAEGAGSAAGGAANAASVGGTTVGAEPAAGAALELPRARADWTVDASLLSYSEGDDRVDVTKAIANLSRETGAGAVSVALVHDTMSGASPTGALRGDGGAVTYSGASGAGASTAAPGAASAGAAPADGSLAAFDDERVQASAALERALGRNLAVELGTVVSSESDYDSIGGNVTLTRERADRLGSAEIGLALTTDTIRRSDVGGTPEPLADTDEGVAFGEGTRNTVDVSFGLSRVLNRTTVAQATLQLGRSSGYHTDPYKVISVVDADGSVVGNRFEGRPDTRTRASLGASLVHRLANAPHSVHLDYRLYGDDWGVVSNTLDARYRHRLSKRQYVEPHARLYAQGAADFHAPFLEADAGLDPVVPADGYASADYRLDALTSVTLGLKYGIAITPDVDLRVRAEYLHQSFDVAEYGTLGAGIVQTSVGWRF